VWTGRQISSNCARSRVEVELLNRHGGEIKVFELESTQFFASSAPLNEYVRRELPGVRTAVLDWSGVSSIDTSLAMGVARLQAYAQRHGVQMLHAGTQLNQGLVQEELTQHVPGALTLPDLDRALEWAENRLIEFHQEELAPAGEGGLGITGLFAGLGPDHTQTLIAHMERLHYERGQPLVQMGDPGDRILLILSGTASVIVPFENQPSVRLAGIRRGSWVGEVGFLDGAPRSAHVIADDRLEALVLTRPAYDLLATEHPMIVQHLLTELSLDLASRLRTASRHAASKNRNTKPQGEAPAKPT